MYMQLVISHYMSLGDTASNLGSAVDELMRHQPTLKTDATTAIIKVLLFIYFWHPSIFVRSISRIWLKRYWLIGIPASGGDL